MNAVEIRGDIFELSLDEAFAVNGGGGPENNPPGFKAITSTLDGVPDNNPPG
jgi:hypothetical protein